MSTVPQTLRKGRNEATIPYALNNFSVAFLQYGYINTSNSLDLQRTALLDVKRDYTLFDYAGELQFGGKYVAHWHRRNSSAFFSPHYNGVQFKSYMINSSGQIVPKNFAQYGFANLQQQAGLISLTNFIGTDTRNIFGKYARNPIFNADRMRNLVLTSPDNVIQSQYRQYRIL